MSIISNCPDKFHPGIFLSPFYEHSSVVIPLSSYYYILTLLYKNIHHVLSRNKYKQYFHNYVFNY